jgi:PASTA domain
MFGELSYWSGLVWRSALGALTCAAFLLGGGVAAAQGAALAVAAKPNPGVIPPFNPETGGGSVQVTATLSGSADRTDFLDLYFQPNSTPCAATTDEEKSEVDAGAMSGSGAFESAVNGGTVGQGPFSEDAAATFDTPRVYRLCAYLTPDDDPAGNDQGPPDATATTLLTIRAGSSPPKPKACVVPHLAGKPLSAAKRALAAAGCRLGSVRRVPAKRRQRGRVLSQHPSPGKRLAPGAKVNVTAGR